MSEPTASSRHGDGVVVDLDLQCAELLAHEVESLAGLGDPRALMHLGAQLLQLIGQRLGPPTAGVHDHQLGARGQVGGGFGDQLGGFLACLGGGFQHDDALVGEQRRAEQFGQFVDADIAGAHPVDGNVVGAGALAGRRAARPRWRARPAAPRPPVPDALPNPAGSPVDRVTCGRQLRQPLPARRTATRRAARSRPTPRPARNHHHRHSSTASNPSGADRQHARKAPTAQAHSHRAHSPTSARSASSHHISGPVNRISSSAPRRPEQTQRRRGGSQHRDRRDQRRDRKIGRRRRPG